MCISHVHEFFIRILTIWYFSFLKNMKQWYLLLYIKVLSWSTCSSCSLICYKKRTTVFLTRCKFSSCSSCFLKDLITSFPLIHVFGTYAAQTWRRKVWGSRGQSQGTRKTGVFCTSFCVAECQKLGLSLFA